MSITKTKLCSKTTECVHPNGPNLPATSDYFYRDMSRPDGLRSECKPCYYQMRGLTGRYVPPKGYRRCASGDKCLTAGGPILPATADNFWNDGKQMRRFCKACQRESVKQWKHAHPEITRESVRRSQRRNPEYQRIKRKRRDAKRKALPASFTTQDWLCALEYWHGACAYCGNPPSLFDNPRVLHQDHFIPMAKNGAYTADNILPACPRCNVEKSDNDAEEWIADRFGRRQSAIILNRIRNYFSSLARFYNL